MRDKINNNDAPKRKRGRPKKEPKPRPVFDSDADLRQYLLDIGIDIVLEMKEQALKKNNIKKPEIARAKTGQYKLVLDAIKTINMVLKDRQLDILETKINNFELGLNHDDNEAVIIEFDKLQDDFREIKETN